VIGKVVKVHIDRDIEGCVGTSRERASGRPVTWRGPGQNLRGHFSLDTVSRDAANRVQPRVVTPRAQRRRRSQRAASRLDASSSSRIATAAYDAA